MLPENLLKTLLVDHYEVSIFLKILFWNSDIS